ncbi:MAG: hypothetical protein QNI99_07820 [Woeseiaceae bacterium]|nr:hypothetical protein [Woeseiaceae bacterium]
MNERYAGKPLLRLLECYALDAIGKLEAKDEASLTAMEPKLAELFEVSGTWKEIIDGVMEFPPDMASLIQEMWTKNQDIAKQAGVELEPQQFAEMFVDQNFSDGSQ